MAESNEGKPVGIHKKLFAFYQRIQAIGKDLNLPADSSGKTYYAVSENAVLEKVRPVLDELRLIVTLEKITEMQRHGETTTIIGEYRWTDIDSGESVIMASGGQGTSKRDKGLGMALTYSQKYMFLKYVKATTGDDPDNKSDHQHDKEEEKSQEMYNGAMNLLEELKTAGLLKTDFNYKRIYAALKGLQGNEPVLARAYNTLMGVKNGQVDPNNVAPSPGAK